MSFKVWSTSLLVITAVTILRLPCISARVITTATCVQFDWMNNSKSQSPCLVAAYLESACSDGSESFIHSIYAPYIVLCYTLLIIPLDWEVPELPEGAHYSGPTKLQVNPCQCSTVTYSMISACSICQNRTESPWSSWSLNCTTTYSQNFTEAIPADTAVPAWAYLAVPTSGFFDPGAAQEAGDAPESTAASPAPSSTPQSKSKKSNSGAIAGGVIGGFVGLSLILGAIVFFVIRRRRVHKVAPSAAYGSMLCGSTYQSSGLVPSPQPTSQFSVHSPFSSAHANPKLYDPSDPSTFPSSSPTPVTIYTTQSEHGQPHDGQYNFAPEI